VLVRVYPRESLSGGVEAAKEVLRPGGGERHRRRGTDRRWLAEVTRRPGEGVSVSASLFVFFYLGKERPFPNILNCTSKFQKNPKYVSGI
jgi:hypothetical protein